MTFINTKPAHVASGAGRDTFRDELLDERKVSRSAREIQLQKSGILRGCQNAARRFNVPLLDAVLARIIARALNDLDVSVEIELARCVAALSEYDEGRVAA